LNCAAAAAPSAKPFWPEPAKVAIVAGNAIGVATSEALRGLAGRACLRSRLADDGRARRGDGRR